MPVRLTWPAALWPKIKRPPTIVQCHIERLCGHEEWLPMLASRGWYDSIVRERHKLCATCATQHTQQTLLAQEPRLRIHHEGALWGVERLMGHTMQYEIIAFLASVDECMEWIRNTFAGRHYYIVEVQQ